jgi:hypothetical protein
MSVSTKSQAVVQTNGLRHFGIKFETLSGTTAPHFYGAHLKISLPCKEAITSGNSVQMLRAVSQLALFNCVLI